MVSSLPFSWDMLHDGVMRRSVASDGSEVDGADEAVEMMTETSAGVGWNDMLYIQYVVCEK